MNERDKRVASERVYTQVRVGGEAGQGVILAGVLLAEAAAIDGREVGQSARYGAAVRGGEALADVVIADEWIPYPHVEQPDMLVLFSQPTYDKLAPKQRPGTLVIYDPFFVKSKELDQVRQVGVAATERAISALGSGTGANLIALGVLQALTGVVGAKSLGQAVANGSSPRFREANAKAVEIGFDIGVREAKR